MTPTRRTAALVGVFFLLTHVTSVGAQLLYGPALAAPTLVGGDGDGALLAGIALDITLAPAVVGTAVALFALLHRHAPGLAAGYLVLRTLEAAVILTGAVALLGLYETREAIAAGDSLAGTDAAALALADLGAQAFIVGPGFICGINTVVGALLVWRTRLVPRYVPILGLIGGPLVLVLNGLKLVDGLEPLMPAIGVALLPIWAWELSLALTLLIRGPRGIAVASAGTSADSALDEHAPRRPDDRIRERVEHG